MDSYLIWFLLITFGFVHVTGQKRYCTRSSHKSVIRRSQTVYNHFLNSSSKPVQDRLNNNYRRLIADAGDGGKNRCDYMYCPYSNLWFKYHQVPATWTDARLICALEGGVLASPITREIRSTMSRSIRSVPIFTGVHATLSKGQYFSIEGVPLEDLIATFVVNLDKEPEYHKGGCLTMNYLGQLTNVDCYKPRQYMCYMKPPGGVGVCGTADAEYTFDQRTKKCYKFHRVPRNFSRANLACEAEGGHLAILRSETDAKVLKDIFFANPAIKMVGNFWKDVAYVGFYDWGEHGEWRTIHGQTIYEAGYGKFSPGEPNNSTAGEYCGSIYRTGLLNDLWCERQHPFICEKKTDYPRICDWQENLIGTDGAGPDAMCED